MGPAAHRFGHAAEFRVGAAFEMIVALKLERNILRPALGAFDKAIVEGGHGSWRIYTKSGSDRSAQATLFAFQIPTSTHERTIFSFRVFWALVAFLLARWLCEIPLQR